MKKKKFIAIGAVAASVAILAAGTLALFTARTNSNMTAVAGTVQISLSDLDMTNKQNINPGDGDPSISELASPGTDHNFSYIVSIAYFSYPILPGKQRDNRRLPETGFSSRHSQSVPVFLQLSYTGK